VANVTIPSVVAVGDDNSTIEVCAELTEVYPTTGVSGVNITLATGVASPGKFVILSKVLCSLLVLKHISASATANLDFVEMSVDLDFPVPSRSGDMQCINLTTLDDSALEENETFILELTTLNAGITFGNTMTNVVIVDNDG